jgi:hypothetical protein
MKIVTKKKAKKNTGQRKFAKKTKAAKKKSAAVKKTASIKETVPADGQAAADLKKTPPEVVPMPTAGRKVTEFEDLLDASLLTGDETPKRGRGRPRKEVESASGGPEIDVKVIGQAIQIPFDLWSISQDVPDLKISVQESVMIAKPLKQILDHYMPNVPDIAWAWISLSAVSYSIVKSRLVLIAEIKKTKTSSGKPTGEQEVPERRGQGRPQSAAFPSFEEIRKPVT